MKLCHGDKYGEAHFLRSNQGIEIPPGVAHQFTNQSSAEVTFLVISAPKAHGDRVGTSSLSVLPLFCFFLIPLAEPLRKEKLTLNKLGTISADDMKSIERIIKIQLGMQL